MQTDATTYYHLTQLLPSGTISRSAIAVPYKVLSRNADSKLSRLSRPEDGIVLDERDQQNAPVLVKCFEVADMLQMQALEQAIVQLQQLNVPKVFVPYTDIFSAYNGVNNSLFLYAVREYYHEGTLEQHIAWMASSKRKNISVNNICLTDNGRNVRMVDFLPSVLLPEVLRNSSSAMSMPKDDHVFRLFKPETWTMTTDLEAIGYVILQLSIVGHPDYDILKKSADPYSIHQRWGFLMEAIWENHGFYWMQMIEKLLGSDYAPHRQQISEKLLQKIHDLVDHGDVNADWGSTTDVDSKPTRSDLATKQHNIPDPAVLVSWIEQAWEFFQHGNHNEFQKICCSMLKSVPADHQGAFRSHHLRIIEKIFRASESDTAKFNLATLLAGTVYADNVDKAAAEIKFDDSLLSLLAQHYQSPDLVSMLSTALAQIYSPKRKTLVQRLDHLPILLKTALAQINNWPAFLPTFMCFLQNVARVPISSLGCIPIIPLLTVALNRHLDFPCEIHHTLRFLRRMIHKSTLGAHMLIRFRANGIVYSPVNVFLAVLRRHGRSMHIHREILLITAHLWAMPEFFLVMIADGWYKILEAVSSLTQDKNLIQIIEQCLADRHLLILNQKLFRISDGRAILGLSYGDGADVKN